MSKIFCDICGTAYPETALQCPICGTARSDTARPAGGDSAAGEASDYAYVKGGRFSHSNVRKRNSNKELPRRVAPVQPAKEQTPVETKEERQPARPRKEQEDSGNNLGLIIIVVILVLAIVAACAYIAIRYIDGGQDDPNPSGTPSTGSYQPSASTVPCTGLKLTLREHTFTNVGDTMLIDVKAQPENTTDTISFVSSDPYIATVDASGKVTAVANGTVTITIRCGNVTESFQATCQVGVDPVYPTEPPKPTEPQPTDPRVLALNREDFTLSGYGSTHDLLRGVENAPSRDEIVWTSDDETVATVENGVVTAVGNGKTTVYAEYAGQKVSCIVRCNNVEPPKDYEPATIYGPASDITIRVGESLTLQLVHRESGMRVSPDELTFTVAKEGYITVDSSGRITGVNVNRGGVYVYIEYEGVTYKCLVRVNAKS